MTFDMVMMIMGWPYDSFDCLLCKLYHANGILETFVEALVETYVELGTAYQFYK